MLLRYLIILIFSYISTDVTSQGAQDAGLMVEGLSVLDAYDDERGYYLFYPTNRAARPAVPIVFIHGYGALNPLIYGGWIRHLVEQGHPVVFPRYQKGLLITSADDFVPNTAAAITEALKRAREENIHMISDQLYLIGHSYGGVISANLAVTWSEWKIPEPGIALLAEPGSGPLKGGVLDTYDGISKNLQLVVIVGDEDHTVGQKFGVGVYESAIHTPARALLWQFACAGDSSEVSSSHYEPYAIDTTFDNGIDNLTTRRALRVGRTDQIDHQGYWKVFDMLKGRVSASVQGAYTLRELEMMSDLGYWPNKTPLRKMEYRCPEPSGSR
jgi:pimeloyl-ACP methyl ester carboxylesterase